MTDWTPVDLLPGLWLGLLGTCLAAALRRWYDPVPGRVLAVFVAVLLVLFAPVLFGGKVLLPPARPHAKPVEGDLLRLIAPSQAAVREALEAGRWPLWNRRAGAGMPLLADPQSQALQPLTLLGLALPLLRAAGFAAALRVLIALIFTFLWLGRLGLREGPALAGSLAWGIGFLLFWVGFPVANVAALLPVVLYAVVRLDEEGGGRDRFLLALAILGLLLAGDLAAIVCALGLLLLFLLERARRRPAGMRRALVAHAGAALLVAAAVSAPVLLPTLFYLPKAVTRFSFVSWRWMLPRGHDLGRCLPKTQALRGVRYELARRASRGFRMAALGDVLPPNLAGLYDMVDVRIYNPMAPKAYVEFTKPITAGWRGGTPQLGALDDPLYQRLGVRYLLTTLEAQLPPPWARIFAGRTVAVWEQPDAFPLFFLATPNPAGGVLTQTIEDAWISGPVHLRRRQWLGTSVYQDGGWLLLIDGRLRHTSLDRGTFVTLRLPRGAMRLDLLYRPAAFVWGWALAALGVVAGVMLFVARPTAPEAAPPPAAPG